MTALVLAVACVVVAGLTHHGFISWLELRERERLSATDKAELVKRFELLEQWKNDAKSQLSGLRR